MLEGKYMKRRYVQKIIVILQAFAMAAGSLFFGLTPSIADSTSKLPIPGSAIIADHNHATLVKLKSIPLEWIDKAKKDLHIVYGHTSHGSQVTDGMTGLSKFLGSTYSWNNGGTEGALDLRNTPGNFNTDLGNSSWASITRNYLKANSDINVVMWAWCGQVSTATESYINIYLKTMSQLEKEFPEVRFVYMTGHTDGSGVTGNLHLRNEQIRKYCRENNKILFDFADIESYDPDGNYYLDKAVNDGCHYDSDGNGSRDKNWAESWQNSHKLNEEWFHCTSAHSQPLTANMKAYAAWYMFARIAGWDGEVQAAHDSAPAFEPIGSKAVNEGSTLSFTVNVTGGNNKNLLISAFTAPNMALPEGASFNAISRTFSWTPSFTQSGQYTLRFTVTDGESTVYQDVPVTVHDRQVGSGTSAYDRIQAENYTDMFGVESENCSEGGRNLGWIQDGDYTSYYGIDFGQGAKSFAARVSSQTDGGRIELRLDNITGELIGTCNVPSTGGWQEWKTVTCPVTEVTGTHELFLIYRANDKNSDYLMNINWFQFEAGEMAAGHARVTSGSKTGISTDLLDRIGSRPLVEVTIYQSLTPSGRIIYDMVELDYDPTAEELKSPEYITVRLIDGPMDTVVPSGRYNPSTGKISFTPSKSGRYAVTFERVTFPDITDAYARAYIEALASKGFYDWLKGKSFNPGRNITRAEFLYLLITALDLHASGNDNFTDVSTDAFYCEAARVAKRLGISNGIGDNRLGPEDDITRQDMVTMVVKALKVADKNLPKITSDELVKYKDGDRVANYAKESMAILVRAGIIMGYDNSLYPQGKVDMQQAATLIYRLYQDKP